MKLIKSIKSFNTVCFSKIICIFISNISERKLRKFIGFIFKQFLLLQTKMYENNLDNKNNI